MEKIRKGEKMHCFPCGREVVIDCCGAYGRTLWCCDSLMKRVVASGKKAKRR